MDSSEEYYDQAIECFQNRFGREDIVIELYVRELLGLILNSAAGRENRLLLVKLYDKIETYLRPLKMLGVTSEKCESILNPLVESCLPLDLLRVWERSYLSDIDAKNADTARKCNKLDSLMAFLKGEIEGGERSQIARQGFGLSIQNKNNPRLFQNHDALILNSIPTGIELMTTSSVKDECIFCGKSHPSVDCRNAHDLSYTDKRSILIKKKGYLL